MNKHNPPELIDKLERKRIIEDLDKNILVEASAGSGKTSSLIHRMVALIKSGKFKVDEIAAITFTKKASIELKERFQQKVEDIFRETKDEKEKRCLKKALTNLEQCYLGTIHAFCARILRERPIEAGLDPEFGELDELDNTLLKEDAWERYLLNLKIKEAPSLLNLEKIGIKPSELINFFKTLCTYPEVKPLYQMVPRPDLKDAFREMLSFCKGAGKYVPEEEPEAGYDKLQEAILQVKRMKGFQDFIREDYNKIKLLENFEGNLSKGGIILKRWKEKERAKEYRDSLLLQFQEKTIHPTLRKWREYCYAVTLNFILPAAEYYHDLRQKISLLNFEDLLLKTSSLLRDYPEVRQYFQKKYKCLLVDEFQDTDPVQAEIIFYLTGQNNKERNWQKLIPRPGSLFVVGDPQQSIYRFRRADIAIYNLIKKLIKKSGGEVLKLMANFRSLHSIGSYLNPIFEQLFLKGKGKYQADYSPMYTVLKDSPQIYSGVKQLIIPKEKSKSDTLKKDAQSISNIIRDMVNSPSSSTTYKDFMIILHKKSGMDIYARTLAEQGIPFTISGFTSLNESRQVKELLKLFRLLKDVENQILLVAVLRGMFFGFSDNDLYRFKEIGGEFDFYGEIPKKLDPELKDSLYNAFYKLRQYHQWTQKMPPVVAMEKIIIDSGLISHACLQGYNLSKCGELYFILEKLRKAESGEVIMFGSMVDQIEKMLEAGIEEELNMLTEENTVRIMNLHKAKGLESPVVFLAVSYSSTVHEPSCYVERTGQKPNSHFLVCRPNPYNQGKGKRLAQPENWEDYCSIESSYSEAENIRLLYVAATRAKHLLVISSLNHQSNKSNAWLPLLKNIKEEISIPVPEIALPVGKTVDKEKENESLLDEYKNIQKKCGQWIINVSKGSYCEKKPTDFKDEEKHRMIKTIDVGGKEWGTAVHKIFDILIKEDPDEQLLSLKIGKTLETLGISIKRKEELEKIIQDFKKNDLYRRLKNAELKYGEVPFTTCIKPDNSLYEELKSDCQVKSIILSGTIDLVFKEADGWVVVDYKTDCPENRDDYPRLTEVYQKQIDIYRRVWQEISGEKVKQSFIHYI